jgi:protoporphyrinogen oxidase
MERRKWGIVGGGIMGMTLAHRLAQNGDDVTLFEGAPDLGGLVSSWKMGEIEWDKFYHVILLSDFGTRGMLRELGLEDKINWVETKTGFYIKGKLVSMSDSIEFLRFPTLNMVDKFRLAITILLASKIKDWKRLERIPVTTWLRKWSGENTFNNVWLPLLRAKLGESYKRTSAVFIWATIQRMYGARRSGLKKEMFGYVPGGYKGVIEAYKQKLLSEGVTIKVNHLAKDIFEKADGKPIINFTNDTTESFDSVIVTLPSGIASRVCKGLSPSEMQKHNDIEYLGVICVAVLLDQSISPFYVTNITDTWVPFTGVIEMSALVDKNYFGGNSLVYLPKYVSPDDPLFDQSDEEVKTYFCSVLLKMYPWLKEENFKFKGVARAKHVITVSKLGYSDNLPDIKTAIPGVYIVNSAHILDGTVNVNETIKVAESKLVEVLNDFK